MRDVVSARDVVPPQDISIVDVTTGTDCNVLFEGVLHKARILAVGMTY